MSVEEEYGHYYRDVRHLEKLDIYRFFDLFEITDPACQHAIKKLAAAGKRGAKDVDQDISEAIDSLLRKREMLGEDANKGEMILAPKAPPIPGPPMAVPAQPTLDNPHRLES